MYKRLVYRGDDIGYTLAFDLGAFKAIDEGIVTSADVMLDSPHTVEALKWLKERPWISVGWHRHLWERPVANPELIPTMVDGEGRFKWRHHHMELMDEVPYEEAKIEFEAELERCFSILGRYPDTTTIKPKNNELERAFLDVCKKYNIHYNIVKNMLPAKVNPEFEYLDYKCAIDFSNNGHGYDLKYFKEYDAVKSIMKIQWENDEQILMYGGHPGFLDDYILEESKCSIHRVEELRGCTNQKVLDWIISNKIELVNQRDVMYGTDEYQNHLKDINSPLWIGNFNEDIVEEKK